MTDLKNIKKKIIRLLGKFSEIRGNGITSMQTEIESPEGVVTISEYVVLDCGCHFDHAKIFVDKWSGKTVCDSCCCMCAACGQKLWVEMATKIGNAYLCPEHRFSGTIMLALTELAKRKED
jgi:hypothetical protein